MPSWERGECTIPNGCRFDTDLATRASWFFEGGYDRRRRTRIPNYLHHVKGQWAGQPFILTDWQRQDIREIFGRVYDDGTRVIRQVYIEVGKKNGKSECAAGIALKLLFADSEYGAEIYGAASDIEQAAIVFKVAASMVRHSLPLRQQCGDGRYVLDSTKRIAVPGTESFYRALTAEVAGKHGFNSHGVVFDEIHCQKDFRLWETLTFRAGAARRQPLVYGITHAGIPGECPVAEMLHAEAESALRGASPCAPHFYPVIYTAAHDADHKDDWKNEEVWRHCNPALGEDHEIGLGKKFLRMADMRQDFQDAIRRPSLENVFRARCLNQWLAQAERWISMDAWSRCAGRITPEHAKRLMWYGGLDLSTKRDVTALVLCALDGNGIFWLLPYFWVPADNLTERPNIEAHKYREWIKQGHIIATPGNAIDFRAVRERIKSLKNGLHIKEIAFDPQFATELSQDLAEAGFTMVEYHQGYKHFTEVMDGFDCALADGMLRHGDNPMLTWMADCVRVKQRADGAIRPVKPDRQKSSARIDGIVAALMAMARVILNPVLPPSIYENAATAVI